MDENEDLTLPEDDSEADSKISFGEEREQSEKQKKILRKQKRFEFDDFEGKKLREEEDLEERKKDQTWKWIVGSAALLLLILLYFWLVN